MNTKRIAAAAAAVLMAISAAGCSSSENKSKQLSSKPQKGRYVEEILDLKNIEFPSEFVKADGEISFVNEEDAIKRYVSDGKNVTSEELDLKFPNDSCFATKIQQLPDGRGAVLYTDQSVLSFDTEDIEGNGITQETDTDDSAPEILVDIPEDDTEADPAITEKEGGIIGETEFETEDPADAAEETAEDEVIHISDDYDSGSRFVLIRPDGSFAETEIEEKNIFDFEISEDGRLFVSTFSGRIYKVDLDTGKSELFYEGKEDQANYIDIAGKYIIIPEQLENKVTVIDAETAEEIGNLEALNDFCRDNITFNSAFSGVPCFDFCEGEDGTIYIACTAGIYRYVIGGNKVEQLIDGSSTSLSMTDSVYMGPSSVVYEGNDSFLVECAAGIVRYRFDPDAEENETSCIKIYTLKSDEKITTAVNTFRRTHPEIGVELETGMKDKKTYDDAVKDLLSEIVSDDAPDVIILDGLDIHNFIDKDLLKDLTEYLPDITPEEGLIEGAALWNDRDGVYSAAGCFAIPSVACNTGDLDKLDTLKDVAEYSEKQKDDNNYAMNLETSFTGSFIKNLLQTYGNEISDGKNSADPEKIKDFFENCGKIYNASFSGEDPMENEYEEQDEPFYTGTPLAYLTLDNYHLSAGMLDSYPNSINCITTIKDYNDKIDYRYGGSSSVHAFQPIMNAAICSRSDNTDEAKEFIKIMLSKDNQDNYVDNALPVNKASFEYNFTDRTDLFVSGCIGYGTEDESEILYKYTDEAEEKELMEYLSKLDTAVLFDEQTTQKIVECGTKYLNGDSTLDEAAEEVRSFLLLRNKE